MVIGFSVCFPPHPSDKELETLEQILQAGCKAIELNPLLQRHKYQPSSDKFIELVNEFEYRSIHLPPDMYESDKKVVDYYSELARDIKAHSVTMHPASATANIWLEDAFSQNIGIENMDWRKTFGKSVSDFKEIFAAQPNAKWVCDTNHILTNDHTMRLSKDFHAAFSDRLIHYHVSGFVNAYHPHGILFETKQSEIVRGILDKTKPIIIESFGEGNLDEFQQELDYISPILNGGDDGNRTHDLRNANAAL